MALQSGKYIISNKASGLHLGRGIREDDSLLPKHIVTLPGGVRAPTWKVERLHDGRYKLAVSKMGREEDYVAEIDGKLYAILNPKGPVRPTEWTIKPIRGPGGGENVYQVDAPSGKVWTVPHKQPNTQVTIERIMVLGEPAQDEIAPPHSPLPSAEQLFIFNAVRPREESEDNDD